MGQIVLFCSGAIVQPFRIKSKIILQNLCWESCGMHWSICSFYVCLSIHVEWYIFLFQIHGAMFLSCNLIRINHVFSCFVLDKVYMICLCSSKWMNSPHFSFRLSIISSYTQWKIKHAFKLPTRTHIFCKLNLEFRPKKPRPSLLTDIPIQHLKHQTKILFTELTYLTYDQ